MVGRKIDLKAKHAPLIALVGSYVGNLLGHIIAPLIIGHEFLTGSVLGGLAPGFTLQRFFVVFTALSLAIDLLNGSDSNLGA